MTTLSGQIFEAIKKETMIGKSVCNPSGRESRNKREILEAVWASEEANGLLRTLMMPRYMEVLMDSEESGPGLLLGCSHRLRRYENHLFAAATRRSCRGGIGWP